jgi:hypothetical protein
MRYTAARMQLTNIQHVPATNDQNEYPYAVIVWRRSKPRNNASVTNAKTTFRERERNEKKSCMVFSQASIGTCENVRDQQTFDHAFREANAIDRCMGVDGLSEQKSDHSNEDATK